MKIFGNSKEFLIFMLNSMDKWNGYIGNIDGWNLIYYTCNVCTNSIVAYEMRNISFTGFYSRVFSFRSTIRYHRWFER